MAPSKPRGRDENVIVRDYTRALVERWTKTRTQKELADKAGVAPSYISQLLSEKLGLGWGAAEGFAKAFGKKFPDFVRDAYDWDRRGRTFETVETEDPYPNRQTAIRALEGVVSRLAIQQLLSVPLSSNADPPVLRWAEMLIARQRELELTGTPAGAKRSERMASDTAAAEQQMTPKGRR